MENNNIYELKEYSEDVLRNTDRLVYGKELLITNPLNYEKRLVNALGLRISTIKQYLETENGHGMNMMEFVLSSNDRKNVNVLVNLVNLYTEQVERQYKLYKDAEVIKTNYFEHDLAVRENLLYKHYQELVSYLLSLNTNDLVWGSFNARDKNRLYDSMFLGNNDLEVYKRSVIKSVAKYMTVDELSDKNQRLRAYNRIS